MLTIRARNVTIATEQDRDGTLYLTSPEKRGARLHGKVAYVDYIKGGERVVHIQK